MPLLDTTYKYPIINHFRESFSKAFEPYAREGLKLDEVVFEDEEGYNLIVEFSINGWNFSFPNTWSGVAFNEPIIDTVLGTLTTYTATIIPTTENVSEYYYEIYIKENVETEKTTKKKTKKKTNK